jgi:hypothetical protein
MMNDKTDSQVLRCAAAVAVVAAVAVLTASCGVVHISFGGGSASTGSATYRVDLAYAHCMQTHGVPDFPDPKASGTTSISTNGRRGHVSGPLARAGAACAYLLPGGSATASPASAAPTDWLALPSPCHTPQQLRVADGIAPLPDRGTTGRGQTVVLLEFPVRGRIGVVGYRHPGVGVFPISGKTRAYLTAPSACLPRSPRL